MTSNQHSVDLTFADLLGPDGPEISSDLTRPARIRANRPQEFADGDSTATLGGTSRKTGKPVSKPAKANLPRGSSADPKLLAVKIRAAEAVAEKAEIANARSRGELVSVVAVRAEWLTLATDLRNALLAVSGRVAARLSLDRAAAVALDEEIRLALETLPHDQ